MSIVTLTSDWNLDDYYTASVKGRILSRCPDVHVVDITNRIPQFNTALAAFQLKHSYKHFPAGTVHIIAVNCESGENSPAIALKTEGHFFIAIDNGIFGLLLDHDPEEIVEIDTKEAGTFPELSVFAEAACKIIQTGKLKELGNTREQMYKQVPMLPVIDESVINGKCNLY